MDLRQRSRHFGFCIILCAFVLRLAAEGILFRGIAWLLRPEPEPIPTYSETGRNVRFSLPFGDHVRESPAPWIPQPELPAFSGEDVPLAALYNTSGKQPEVETLLAQPLVWDLTAEGPAVLILHTHGTESYTPAEESYLATSSYRTLEEQYNMLSIGDAVAEILEENGIRVIHDREIYDYPSYNGAYVRAREAIGKYLAECPGIRLVLDLHRDASGTVGKQLRTEAVVEGQPAAQLMLVQGTNFEGWQENVSLALKLQVLLERENPGIMRPLNLRSQRFNQDLSPGALLVEVGAAGNTRQEALRAARELAKAIVLLAEGSS